MPASTISIARTVAKMGRVIKNLENILCVLEVLDSVLFLKHRFYLHACTHRQQSFSDITLSGFYAFLYYTQSVMINLTYFYML